VSEQLNDLANVITGRSLLAVVLAYAVFPYAVLWLAVRLWPKDHPRRAEYLAEYDVVAWYHRPLWVGDVAVRCLLDGLAERMAQQRVRPRGTAGVIGDVLLAVICGPLGAYIVVRFTTGHDLSAFIGAALSGLTSAGLGAVALRTREYVQTRRVSRRR